MGFRGRRLLLPTARVLVGYLALLIFVGLILDATKRASLSAFDVQRMKNANIELRGGFHAHLLLLKNEDPFLLDRLLASLSESHRTVAVQLLFSHLLDEGDGSGVEFDSYRGRRSRYGRRWAPAETVATRSPAEMTVFVSVASYRDRLCPYTLRSLFSQALNPGLISVGLVELADVGSGDETCVFRTSGVHDADRGGNEILRDGFGVAGGDEEDSYAGSAELLHSRIKRIWLPVRMGKGPVFTRYFASRMYGGEAFFLMVDSHSAFTLHWDAKLFRELVDALRVSIGEASRGGHATVLAAAIPVISHHPPAWTRQSTDVDLSARDLLRDEGPVGWKPADASSEAGDVVVPFLCHAKFDYPELGFPVLYSVQRRVSPKQPQHQAQSADSARVALRQPFVGAGLLFTSALMLSEVPFDPHLPYLFHGEEILLSARLWTSGYDSFAPREVILRHYYYRRESPKYHEDRLKRQDDVADAKDRDALEQASVRRVQYYLQATNYVVPWERRKRPMQRFVHSAEEVQHSSDDEVAWYGMGSVRTLDAFWEYVGVDPRERVCNLTKWCCLPTPEEMESCLRERYHSVGG